MPILSSELLPSPAWMPPSWFIFKQLEQLPDPNAGTPAASGGFVRWTYAVRVGQPDGDGYAADPGGFLIAASGDETDAVNQAQAVYETSGARASGNPANTQETQL